MVDGFFVAVNLGLGSTSLQGKEVLPYNDLRWYSVPMLTVTAKGQITLKQELLRHLNVSPGQKVEVDKLPDGRIALGAAARTGSIDNFIGSLEQKGGPRLSIAQIKKITEDAWAAKR